MEKYKIPLISFASSLALVLFAVFLADLLYWPKKLVKRGYEIQISTDGKPIIKEEKPIDINALIKIANFDNGAKIFKKCATCHNAEKNGGNKIGPNLYNVVGRKKAMVAGFTYSEAMVKKGGSWLREDLNLFLTKPKDYVIGTKMGFAGLKKPQDRADVILYLEKKQ